MATPPNPAHATREREFLELLEVHSGIIHKVIRLYVDHPEDQKDVYQEVVGQAWKSFPSFKREAKFSTWLYRVSANTVLLYRRKPAPVKHSLDALGHLEPSTAEEATQQNQSQWLLAAVRQLPETDRLLVSLHLDGYQNDEIADIAGLSKNNVAVKLHRIKQQLIKMLNPASVKSA